MPNTHFSPTTLIFVAVFGFLLYRRYRRTVGRQPLVPKRLTFQVILLAGITLLVFVPLLAHPLTVVEGLAGLLVGGLVGLVSLRLTQFERTPDRDYYTPNTYLGLAVFGVFLARIIYRYTQVSSQISAPHAAGPMPPGAMSALTSSPLTVALLLMVIGYYLIYEGGLLLWYRRNPPGTVLQGQTGSAGASNNVP
ncbi:MAG: DUF1453 family protein [Armatimonadota bacterium]|nr:DUF1453 family protein [Armatimonadota bacterium]